LFIGKPGQAKIDHPTFSLVVQHQVAGLEIAVDYASIVGGLDGFRRLGKHVGRVAKVGSRQRSGQRLATVASGGMTWRFQGCLSELR